MTHSDMNEIRVRKARCFMAKNKYKMAIKKLDKPSVEL